jgi:glutamate formiminotransferase / formiminotetrahydrofolate cyclodeaminase
MKPIVECVPNISEGKDRSLIDKVAASVSAVKGVKLLGVEPDKDYNRSVVTFVGTPDAVLEAALQLTRTASSLIDMRSHKGEHPRIGAVDVVPFVPISGVTMQDCVGLARRYGESVSRDLKIPVYLYEAAASSPARRNLADIRKGEYEGLSKKLQDPLWKPDFGQPLFNERSGAIVAGARTFLIAYNVNLNTPDSTVAHEIALRIRESGRVKKDDAGQPMKDPNGKPIKIAGTLKAVKAMGVFLERHNIAQVSINLVDFETTALHDAFEEVKRQAKTLGAEATGSEIVGLTPLKALLLAGAFYAKRESLSPTMAEPKLVELAVQRLGLSQLETFDPSKKIIEYQL